MSQYIQTCGSDEFVLPVQSECVDPLKVYIYDQFRWLEHVILPRPRFRASTSIFYRSYILLCICSHISKALNWPGPERLPSQPQTDCRTEREAPASYSFNTIPCTTAWSCTDMVANCIHSAVLPQYQITPAVCMTSY